MDTSKKELMQRIRDDVINLTESPLHEYRTQNQIQGDMGKFNSKIKCFYNAYDEISNIQQFLTGAFEVLKPGGRLVCISFHSLEDRPVKHFFQEKAAQNKAEIITKKPITASSEEIRSNPSSRSAKLRILQKGTLNFG